MCDYGYRNGNENQTKIKHNKGTRIRLPVRRPPPAPIRGGPKCAMFFLVPGGVYFPGFQALGEVRRRRRTRAYTAAPLRPRRGPRPFAAAVPLRRCRRPRACYPFLPPSLYASSMSPRPSSRTTTTVTDTRPSAAVSVGTVTDAAQAPEGGDNVFIRRCPYMPPIGTWIWVILCNV